MTELSLGPAAAFSVLVVVIVFVVIALIGRVLRLLPRAGRGAGDEPAGGMTASGTEPIGVRCRRRRASASRIASRARSTRRATSRLDVAPGEFLTLLGPSGCGKTTTLRMIAGFEKPDAGASASAAQDVTGMPANQRNIGFVFQNYALFPHLSVFENVAYGLRVRGLADAEVARARRARCWRWSASRATSSSSRASSRAASSSASRWRAPSSSARACCCSTSRCRTSTPSCACRCATRSATCSARLAITTVYVTHDQEEAMAVSDRIAVMNQGSVVQEGTAEDLYHRPASRVRRALRRPREPGAGRVAAIAAGRRRSRRSARCSARAPSREGLAEGDAVRLVAAAGSDRDRRGRARAGPLQATVARARSSARRSNTCCAARTRRCRSCATTPAPASHCRRRHRRRALRRGRR